MMKFLRESASDFERSIRLDKDIRLTISGCNLARSLGAFFLCHRASSRATSSSTNMIKSQYNRIDPKRRITIDHKKQQFALPTYKQQEYPHRLNLYETPPTADITLEEFEQWAIDRLRSTAYISMICNENC